MTTAKKQASTINSSPFIVYLPGLTGGGKYISLIREATDWFIPSSVSTKSAFKKGEKSLGKHYTNLATQVAQLAGTKEIILVGHSLGGFEMVDLLNHLADLDDLKSKKMTLVVLTVPGFSEKGVTGLTKLIKNLLILLNDVSLHDQHTLYPTTEKYYLKSKNAHPYSHLKIGYGDSLTDRQARKTNFENTISNPTLITQVQELDKSLDQLLETSPASSRRVQELLRKRANLLFWPLQHYFHGRHVSEHIHTKWLQEYNERPDNLESGLQSNMNFVFYLLKCLKRTLTGLPAALTHSIQKLQRRGINVSLQLFVIGERDPFVSPKEIARIVKNTNQAGLDITPEFFFFEQMSHSSVGYYPIPLREFLRKKQF